MYDRNRQKRNCRRAAWVGLLVCAALVRPSVAWCIDRPPQQDAAVTAQFVACDTQAEQESARAMTLTPISPTSVLSPFLMLNDLNQRKQEEAMQPQRLEQIELQRQQCRRNVVAASARRVQETLDERSEGARGYRSLSFDNFALDAKALATVQARISMKGAYLPDGNSEWFFASQQEAIQASTGPSGSRNIFRIPLLTEDASREFRKALLRCKSSPGSDRLGCPAVITGHVSLCTITNAVDGTRDVPCIVVENGRELR